MINLEAITGVFGITFLMLFIVGFVHFAKRIEEIGDAE